MIFFFEVLFISTLSATTNTLLGKGLLGVVLQWAVIALCVVVLFIPVKARMRIQNPLLLFIGFLYIPFLYFQTAGYDGTALLFSLLAIFLHAVVFKGKQRIAAILLNILVFVGCCVFQYLNPNLIVPHATELDKLVDLVVALVLSTGGIAILAVYVSNAYELERKKIATLLDQDVLTGIHNRRYLIDQLPREIKIAERTGRPLSVMMFDLDHFKNINDTYGHAFGDVVLKNVATAVASSIRSYDIFIRYGGEEFFVALHDTPYESAMKVADNIRGIVQALTFENSVTVTISIGLTQYRPHDTMDSMIERADQYLYQAKAEGRNRVAGQP